MESLVVESVYMECVGHASVGIYPRERPCGASGFRWYPQVSIGQTPCGERREKKEEEGRKRKEGRGGGEKCGLEGYSEGVYAARACAGKYTPATRLNALHMRSGLCPLRLCNETLRAEAPNWTRHQNERAESPLSSR